MRDPETNIRRLLTHCGLEFEPACLAFHETKRPVRTASAEQVRQPLYASGVGYWRHFEPQLEPLRRALGDCLERFADYRHLAASRAVPIERLISAAAPIIDSRTPPQDMIRKGEGTQRACG